MKDKQSYGNGPIFRLTRRIPSVSAGGKAEGLAALIEAGLAVPPGFVILDGWQTDLEGGMEEVYTDLGGGPVAVRSSSMGEDGNFASAAGQYESFLNVTGLDELKKAVEKCFSSAQTGRVKDYHKAMGSPAPTGMAVIVQKMVKAKKAGVLFTADPVTGNPEKVLIEAVPGLGESLVGGSEVSDQYIILRAGGEPDSLQVKDHPLLSAGELKKMTDEALKAEQHFGRPLDLEWAIDDEGALYWLQARPITTLETMLSLDTPVENSELITRCNIGEMLPGAATPLTLSVFAEPLDWGLLEMTRRTGALRGLTHTPRFIVHVENHLFMNLSSMFYIARNVAGASREAIEMNIIGKVLPPYDIGPNAPGFTRLSNGIRYGCIILSHNRYLRKIQRLGRSFRIPRYNRNMSSLYSDLCRMQQTVLNKAYFLHYCVSANSGAMNGALAAALSGGRDVSTEAHARMGVLLTNIEDIESADVVAGFERLAAAIRNQIDARRFQELSTDEAIDWLNDSESGEAGSLYRSFLKRHGHRCIREADLRSKDYESYPEEIIRTIRGLLKGGSAAASAEVSASEEQPAEKQSSMIAWLLKQAKEGVRQRELSKSILILIQHQFKLGYRKLALKMEKAGMIPDSDLIYFFTREEIGKVLEQDGTAELIRQAEKRRRNLPGQMKLVFPETSWGIPEPVQPASVSSGKGNVLTGTPVSRGIVEGAVRVVASLEEAHQLKDGEIMVAPFTDIGWTPFFSRISGLVTEIGGALSHGAVVAREYGLPMVSNIPAATASLKTGMNIRLDGRAGTVNILN